MSQMFSVGQSSQSNWQLFSIVDIPFIGDYPAFLDKSSTKILIVHVSAPHKAFLSIDVIIIAWPSWF